MTVCGNRTDTPGFFTPCDKANPTCVCGDQLRAELAQQARADRQELAVQAQREWLAGGGAA